MVALRFGREAVRSSNADIVTTHCPRIRPVWGCEDATGARSTGRTNRLLPAGNHSFHTGVRTDESPRLLSASRPDGAANRPVPGDPSMTSRRTVSILGSRRSLWFLGVTAVLTGGVQGCLLWWTGADLTDGSEASKGVVTLFLLGVMTVPALAAAAVHRGIDGRPLRELGLSVALNRWWAGAVRSPSD